MTQRAPANTTVEPEVPRRRPGWLATHWPYIVAAGAVLAAAYLAPNIIADQRLGAELARLRARHAPLSLAQAAPPKLPDAQNAALLYLKAFKGLATSAGGKHAPQAGAPRPPVLRRGSVDNVEATQLAVFLEPTESKRLQQPVPSLQEMEGIIAAHQAQFRLLDQASRMKAASFPVNWASTFNALSPHYAGVRGASDFLAAKAIVEARAGRGGDALGELTIILRMSNHIAPEPTLMAQLVGSSCIKQVWRTAPQVLEVAAPSASEARAFYDTLGKLDLTKSWVHAYEGERAGGVWMYYRMWRESPAVAFGRGTDSGVPAFFQHWRTTRQIWKPFLKLDEALYLQHMNRLVAAARQPYPQSRQVKARLEQEAWRAPRYAIFYPLLTPVFSRATDEHFKAMAIVSLMQAAMALRAYQIEHGAYPTSLAALQKAGGWKIPADPFTGKPFVYRRQSAGYIIYSLGPDMKDDGGVDEAATQKRPWKPHAPPPTALPAGYDIPLRVQR